MEYLPTAASPTEALQVLDYIAKTMELQVQSQRHAYPFSQENPFMDQLRDISDVPQHRFINEMMVAIGGIRMIGHDPAYGRPLRICLTQWHGMNAQKAGAHHWTGLWQPTGPRLVEATFSFGIEELRQNILKFSHYYGK